MFPDYKTPAIAGAPVGAIGDLKIDLTKLFGGDGQGSRCRRRSPNAIASWSPTAAHAVGMAVGLAKRQADKPQGPKDDLDRLDG